MLEPSGQPATSGAARVRASSSREISRVAEPIEHEGTSLARRVRSAVLLVLLVVTIGLVAAATVGVTAVALTSLLDQALG